MIYSLKASLISSSSSGIVISASPFSLEALCSERDKEELLEWDYNYEVPVVISWDLNGRSLASSCFAFSNFERRELFIALTNIKGIGKLSALAVLDCGEVSDTLRAVVSNDLNYFSPVPGLGKAKTSLVISKLAAKYKGLLPDAIEAPISALVEAREALVLQGMNADIAEINLIKSLENCASVPKTGEKWLDLL